MYEHIYLETCISASYPLLGGYDEYQVELIVEPVTTLVDMKLTPSPRVF